MADEADEGWGRLHPVDHRGTARPYRTGDGAPGSENSRSECSRTTGAAACVTEARVHGAQRQGREICLEGQGRSGWARLQKVLKTMMNTGAGFVQWACVSQNSLRSTCITGIP